MRKSAFGWIGTATIMVLLLTQCTSSNDWTGWRGPNRDGVVAGFTAPAEWPAELTKVWQKTVGLGDASPVLVDDQFFLYVSKDSNDVVLCLDAESGDPIWETITNKSPEITGAARSHPGPRSTPTIARGKIFAMGASGIFSCLDAKTGKILWQNKDYDGQVPRFFTSASPLVIDDFCVIHMGDHDQGVIVAFDVKTGSIVWKHGEEPCTYSSAIAMGENMLAVQAETTLLGFDKTGDVLWNIPTPNERMYYSSSTPVVSGNQVFVSGQGNGARLYEIEESDKVFSPKLLWTNEEINVSFNSPVLKEGYLYGNDARFGYIFCLDASNGETCWTDTTKLNRFATTYDLGEVILSLTANRYMVIFEPNPEAYVEKAKYIVADSDIYASPVVANDKFYIKDQESLICWGLE